MKYQPPYGEVDPDAPYINGDPSIARQGSILPAAAAEYPQREIVNLISSSDLVPTDNDLQQLTRGVRSQWVNFCVDTGSVNNLSVALIPSLTEYKQGTPLRVLCGNNNTGPTVINVNALGNRPVTRSNGSQLQPDDLRTGMIALLVDDGSKFQMVNYLGAIGGITNNYTIDIPYTEDTSLSPNSVTAVFSPPITGQVAGDLVLVKLNNTNSGPVMITINGLAVKPIYRNDGQPLQEFDTLKGECILIEYNTTYWQMLRLVKSQLVQKLNANLLLYVRTDGNDTTGDGSANTSAKAFRTIQRAVDFVRGSYMIAGRTVTIQLGVTGTYVGNVLIASLPGATIIRGDPSNPLGYVVQGLASPPSGYYAVLYAIGAGVDVTLIGLTISGVVNMQHMIEAQYGAHLAVSDCHFTGAPAYVQISCVSAYVTCSNNIHFWNNAQSAFSSQGGGSVVIGLWNTVITTHGNNYAAAFVFSELLSSIWISYPYCTFAGGATGRNIS